MDKWQGTIFLCLAMLASVSVYALSGEAVYKQTCMVCHGADGKGAISGVPSFIGKNTPLKNSNDILLKRVINGYHSPNAPMAMPPRGGNPKLTDTDLKKAIIYIRQKYGQPSASKTGLSKKKFNNRVLTNNARFNQKKLSRNNSEALARGAKAWTTTCSGCHNLRSISEYTPEQWHTIMQHMRVQAHLSGQRTREILLFLQSSS